MRRQAGFTLIELIACIIILGIIGLGTTMVISLGANSFLSSRNADNAGTSAQLALERIAIELRDVNGGGGSGGEAQVLASPPRIVYTTTQTVALPGTRTLTFTGSAITLTPAAGGTAYTLIDGVSSCAMSFSGTGRSSALTVSFTLTNAPQGQSFTITVKPRSNTKTPVTS